ncbi:HTH-type transcriptional regulator CysL [Peptococcaceae bacterium CEB3]|nr:HTH-type transcriptional regulator CysL [Peptococcaceae bacterium CEB3]
MLDLLKLFTQVVEEQSFTSTARHLGVSQPAVSNQMRALEDKLGVKLLLRRGKALVLTAEGEIVLRQARRILDDWDELMEQIGTANPEFAGLVRLGASQIPGEYLLPALLADFQHEFAKVQLKLVVGDSLEMANKVAEREVDFAVVGSTFDSEKLASEFWQWDELMLVLPERHPLAGQREIRLSDLLPYPMIVREEGSGHRRALEETLAGLGLSLPDFRISLEAGSIEAIKNSVRAALGYSFISRSALGVAPEGVRVCRLQDVNIRRGFYLVTRRNKSLPVSSQACYTRIRDYSKQNAVRIKD